MTSQQRSISILGCGWLGKPLAEHFIGQKWRVLGSTTSTEKIDVLEKSGIEAFQIVADGRSELNTPEFFESEILVINVPPVRSPDIEQLYPVQTKQIINAANQGKVRKLIFIGSTSVYAAQNQVADEMDKSSPDKGSGKALLAAEKTVKDQFKGEWCILRFCGLMGPDRHPGRFFQGRRDIDGGKAPVNFIHLHDCIGLIDAIIEKNLWNKVYNACAEEHPLKSEFYKKAALSLGLEPPDFLPNEGKFKKVDSSLIKKESGYQFKYPDPSQAL